MKGQLRIEEMFAFVALDADGSEGVTAFRTGTSWMPMVGADVTRVEQLMPKAQAVANLTGKTIKVLKFNRRRQVDQLEPQAGAERVKEAPHPEEPTPEADGPAMPFQTFSAPQLRTGCPAENVVVFAVMDDGKPGIGVSYLIDGAWLPPIIVTGKVAKDLITLAQDALDGARRIEN